MLKIILIFIGLMAFAQSLPNQEQSIVEKDLVQSLNELIQRTKETHEELKKQTALLEEFNKSCKPSLCKPSECKNENNPNPPPQKPQEGPSGQKNETTCDSNSPPQNPQDGPSGQKNETACESNSPPQNPQGGPSGQKNETDSPPPPDSPPQNTQVDTSQNPNGFIDMQKIIDRLIQGISLINSKKNCWEATCVTKTGGIYDIRIGITTTTVISVPCTTSYGDGWLIFQRRKDGSVDFNRDWEDYKNGFGDLRGEFFLGLEKLYEITNETPQELLVVLKDNKNRLYHAKYNTFAIGDENQSYAMNVLGTYSGNATDSLSYHKSHKFSTKDRDNTEFKNNCAGSYKSGWWFHNCYFSNLNGVYEGIMVNKEKSGIDWTKLKGNNYNFGFTEMMVRPKKV